MGKIEYIREAIKRTKEKVTDVSGTATGEETVSGLEAFPSGNVHIAHSSKDTLFKKVQCGHGRCSAGNIGEIAALEAASEVADNFFLLEAEK